MKEVFANGKPEMIRKIVTRDETNARVFEHINFLNISGLVSAIIALPAACNNVLSCHTPPGGLTVVWNATVAIRTATTIIASVSLGSETILAYDGPGKLDKILLNSK